MNVPIPTPTPEQVAASVALENSRRQYRLQDRVTLLVMHKPDAVLAARDGEPTLADPPPTLAPRIVNKINSDFNESLNPAAAAAKAPAPANTAAPATATDTASAPPANTPPASTAPLQFQDVPKVDAGGAAGPAAVTNVQGNTSTSPATGGNNVGVEVLGSNPNVKATDNGGLKAVGPENATPLPAAEKPAEAPAQVNDVPAGSQPAAQAGNPNAKKNPKPAFEKGDESSSKHKKKKGLDKLNPF
jgi:outer membrane protein assembly factor BamD